MEIRAKSVIFFAVVVFFSAAVVLTPSAQAASTSSPSTSLQAVTNENYSYEELEVKRGGYQSRKHGGRVSSCSFTGRINSTTHTEKRNVTIIFTAFNNFSEKLWTVSVPVKSLPPFGYQEFSEKISCQERDPFYWEIEVIEEEPATR
jgi:hypothetical protein